MWRIKIPDINILSMKLYITKSYNYGSIPPEFEIKLINKNGDLVFYKVYIHKVKMSKYPMIGKSLFIYPH